MRAALERTPTLRDRVFTDGEQAYCDQRRDPTERYAARFAAKEAVLKAMGLGLGACGGGRSRWRAPRAGHRRSCCTAGPRALADERGIRSWRLTMTHTHRLAEAIAVAL